MESLEGLRALGVPEPILRFYERYEPEGFAEGQVRLWGIPNVVMENTKAVPGIAVQPMGYIVFASSLFGDAYCFNLNKIDSAGEPEIILMSHGSFGEDATAEEVHPLAKPVASSLLQFLEQFSKGQVDTKCLY